MEVVKRTIHQGIIAGQRTGGNQALKAIAQVTSVAGGTAAVHGVATGGLAAGGAAGGAAAGTALATIGAAVAPALPFIAVGAVVGAAVLGGARLIAKCKSF